MYKNVLELEKPAASMTGGRPTARRASYERSNEDLSQGLQDDPQLIQPSFNNTQKSAGEFSMTRDFELRGFHRSYIQSLSRPQRAAEKFDVMSQNSEHKRPNALANEVKKQMMRSLSHESLSRGEKTPIKPNMT